MKEHTAGNITAANPNGPVLFITARDVLVGVMCCVVVVVVVDDLCGDQRLVTWCHAPGRRGTSCQML